MLTNKLFFEVFALVLLICMIWYGYYRGGLKMAVAMLALFFTLTIVNGITPYLRRALEDHTDIRRVIRENMLGGMGIHQMAEVAPGQDYQMRLEIEGLNVPDNLKELMIEKNTPESWEALGAGDFTDYVSAYVTEMILNTICFIMIFTIISLIVRWAMNATDVFAKLPAVDGINKTAGGIAGLIWGLIIIWLFFIIVFTMSGTALGSLFTNAVNDSGFLRFLYQLNPINSLVQNIIL